MSASSASFEIYQKFAPRWVKVIRWREWGHRIVEHQKFLTRFIYFPVIFCWYTCPDIFPYKMYFLRPKDPESIRELKQNNWRQDCFQRDYEYGEYELNKAPVYDLTRRRLNYPEYYEGRYKDIKKTVWGEILEITPKKSKKSPVKSE